MVHAPHRIMANPRRLGIVPAQQPNRQNVEPFLNLTVPAAGATWVGHVRVLMMNEKGGIEETVRRRENFPGAALGSLPARRSFTLK